MGRFEFSTHRLEIDGTTVYKTADSLFAATCGREWYKTTGFKDISIVYGTTLISYRKASNLINRMRHREGATPSRTVQDNTEREGGRAIDFLKNRTAAIFAENGFDEDGIPEKDTDDYNPEIETLHEDDVAKELNGLELTAGTKTEIRDNPVGYEDPGRSVSISVDDVLVKRQKDGRDDDSDEAEDKPKKRKHISNTVSHIQRGDGSYVVAGRGIAATLRIVPAFPINNDLLKYQLVFLVDGHQPLRSAILNGFRWFNGFVVILDWYHLKKKCKMQSSLAMKGRKIRDDLPNELLPLLRHGMVDKAVEHLKSSDSSAVKDAGAVERLVGYLSRNKSTIPCYEIRKSLGLRNSSNLVEKMNDPVVSERQKHNGMSWSKNGSTALAVLTSLKLNNECKRWFEKGDIDLKLAA